MRRVARKISPQRNLVERAPRLIQDCIAIQSAKKVRSAPPERSFSNITKISSLQPLTNSRESDLLKFIELFDKMIELCLSESVHSGIETIIPQFFPKLTNPRVTWWENISYQFRYISRRMNCQMPSKNFDCLYRYPGAVFYRSEKSLTLVKVQILKGESESKERCSFYFPLQFATREIFGVVALSIEGLLKQDELDTIKKIQDRFLKYGGNVFYSHQRVNLASRVVVIDHLDHVVPLIKTKIKEIFDSKIIDLWYFDPREEQYYKWDDYSNTFMCVYRCNTGIAGAALRSNRCINESMAQKHSSYVTEVDIEGLAPILVSTAIYDSKTWAVVLRGEHTPYTNADVAILTSMMMFIASSIIHSVTQIMDEHNALVRAQDRIMAAANVGWKLSQIMDVQQLVAEIQEQFRLYAKADLCRVLVLGDTRNFTCGKKAFSTETGIAGACALSKEIIRVVNPSLDSRFSAETDVGNLKTPVISYMISVPVCSPDNDVLAVVNLGWKKSSSAVVSDEEKYLNSVAKFSGIALSNVMKHRDAAKTAENVARLIGNVSLGDALSNTKEVFCASRVTIFILQKQSNVLYELVNVGDAAQGVSESTEEAITFNKIVAANDVFSVPLLNSDRAVVGVMELASSVRPNFDVIECAAFAISSKLNDQSVREMVDIFDEIVPLREAIGGEALASPLTPQNFVLDLDDDALLSLSFDPDDVDLIPFVFMLFDKFSLKREFAITNQTLFLFLKKVSAACKDPESMKRGVSVLQFLAHVIFFCNLQSSLSKIDILTLFIAALCHDIDHELYNNPLFENPYAPQMRACECTFTVLSNQNCNIFGSLDAKAQEHVLKDVIRLVDHTNMSHHFVLVNQYTEMSQKEGFDIAKNSPHRELLMSMLLKLADLNAFCRPFYIANRVVGGLVASGGFVENVFRPMLQALVDSYEQLSAAQKQFEENFEQWKYALEKAEVNL